MFQDNAGFRGSWFQDKTGFMSKLVSESLTKRADALRVEGRRKRERPKLRWEDCVKRYLAGYGDEGNGEREQGMGAVEMEGINNGGKKFMIIIPYTSNIL